MSQYGCARSALKVLSSGLLIVSLAQASRAQAPLAAAQNVVVPSRITQPVTEANRITLRGNTHPLARPQFDQGAVADSQPINRMLLLLQRSSDQETALRGLLDQQQSKASSSFHQWLTPQEFGQQFGPSDADVQTVTGWLQSHGFQVNRVSAGRTVVEFSGNAGQVRGAFNTEIHRYVVNGETHFANAGDPQIPAALAAVVAGPVSMHNFVPKPFSHSRGVYSRDRQTGEVKPMLTGTSNGSTIFALGPADFAKIYNVPTVANGNPTGGSGQSIAIVGDSEICTQNSPDFNQCSSDDVAAFRSFFGLGAISPACPSGSLSGGPVCVIVDGPDPGLQPLGDEIEGDLDTQWSSAIAPSATVDFVVASDTEVSAGIFLAAEYIVDNNLAGVMSESFGACEAFLGQSGNAFQAALWEQAAAQGITPIVSAGDAGSAGCDNSDATPPFAASFGANVNGLASTPYNVAVGGTDFDINLPSTSTYAATFWSTTNNSTTVESAKSYIPEIPWNDSCAQSLPPAAGCTSPAMDLLVTVGGGGGQSNCLNAVASGSSFTCARVGSATGYPKPSWQSGAYVTGTPSTDGLRDVPDVSLFAAAGFKSNSFYAICESDLGASCLGANPEFIGVGGTSSSAPTFAGIMAQVNAKQLSLSASPRQGNANYVLYALASKQATTPPSGGCNSTSSPNTSSSTGCTFYDVTLGNNSEPCFAGSRNCVSSGGDFGMIESPVGTVAFNAGAGYDLATGLGTINVTNLVNNWNSVVGSFKATTTTLCLIAAPTTCSPSSPAGTLTVTHGTLVDGAVAVDFGGTPIPVSNSTSNAEIVSLIGSGGSLPNGSAGVNTFTVNESTLAIGGGSPDFFTLANGQVSFSTKYLVGGASYSVSAHYPGDGNFGASSSTTPITVTVNPEPSLTVPGVRLYNFSSGQFVSLTGGSVLYGDALILRADVVGVNSQEENGTGTVNFLNGANSLGSARLNTEGYAEEQTGSTVDGNTTIAALPVGSYSLSATYGGDNSYCPSPGVDLARAERAWSGRRLRSTSSRRRQFRP